ncbi:MAG: ABC transporter ATP-binding protein/permease [Actinobacteria bacterium]|nr:ABC transporter ATP-binding protein/permease [Actinomycetota bacterium]
MSDQYPPSSENRRGGDEAPGASQTGAASAGDPGASTSQRGALRGRQQQQHGPGLGPPGLIGTGDKPKNFRTSFNRLVGRLRPDAFRIGIVTFLAVVSVAMAVSGPKLLGRAMNIVFEGFINKKLPVGVTKEQVIAGLKAQGDTKLANMFSGLKLNPGHGIDMAALGKLLLVVAAIYLLSSLFAWVQGYIMAGVVQRVVYRLRREVDFKLARLPLKYFDDHPRGDILSRVTNDIDNIQQTLQQTLTQIITAALTLLGVLGMMFWISQILAAISVVTIPLSIAVTMMIAKRSQKQFGLQWQRTGSLNGHVEEMYSGHNIVKVFGRQKEAIAKFDEGNDQLYKASFKAQFISGIIMPTMMFIGNLNYVAICVVGGLRVATGALSLGDVTAFIQYSRQFMQPITQVASVANVLQSAVASAERVFELLDEAEEVPDPAQPVVLRKATGQISLKDVSFRYLPDVPLIEDLNLEVQPGQTVAIVGPTGAGKTTLVNLLMRFYEIDRGSISIDGTDTRKMTRDDLRHLFGMVLQDAWLFGGTIRENIAYGKDDATWEEILTASEAAHVDHFVRTLPEGYDTRLDDDSTNISQGERQLLTIARAFLADPEILILDEATSSVDTRTEVLIQRAMNKLLRGRTSFVIAHRLSTIRDADVILVMNEGRIIEQGTHKELLAARGFYYDLYNSQFAEALVEAS